MDESVIGLKFIFLVLKSLQDYEYQKKANKIDYPFSKLIKQVCQENMQTLITIKHWYIQLRIFLKVYVDDVMAQEIRQKLWHKESF